MIFSPNWPNIEDFRKLCITPIYWLFLNNYFDFSSQFQIIKNYLLKFLFFSALIFKFFSETSSFKLFFFYNLTKINGLQIIVPNPLLVTLDKKQSKKKLVGQLIYFYGLFLRRVTCLNTFSFDFLYSNLCCNHFLTNRLHFDNIIIAFLMQNHLF